MELRPASTVMLCRDAESGIETFLLRRSAASRFVPNAYVFPGGTVDPEDAAEPPVAPDELRRLFRMASPPSERMQGSLVAAARRELFEETGVRLGAGGAFELFSHWITPLRIAPRYDVYFFVARIPAGQRAVADATETHDGVWIAPAQALARAEAGTMHVVYPTRMHLARLRAFRTVEALLAFARTKPVVTVLPDGDEREGFALPAGLEDSW
jgi:recombination protein RecT